MSDMMLAVLSGIHTVQDMVSAFDDEEPWRRLLEAMVWRKGRICPVCGYRHSVALAGRDRRKFRAAEPLSMLQW